MKRFLQQILLAVLACTGTASAVGTWAPWTPTFSFEGIPSQVFDQMVLVNGDLLVHTNKDDGKAWVKFTADSNGDFTVNSKSMQLPNMNHGRNYFATVVLRDGRLLVVGGKYSKVNPFGQFEGPSASAEIYDPVSNMWTLLPAIPAGWNNPNGNFFAFGEATASLMADGNVLISSGSGLSGDSHSAIYQVAANQWADGPVEIPSQYHAWVKLNDGSLITRQPATNGEARLYANTNTWVNEGSLPYSLSASSWLDSSAAGPAIRLPDGRAWFIGANNLSLIFDPANAAGSRWVAGPGLPSVSGQALAGADGSAAALPDGKLLVTMGSWLPAQAQQVAGPVRCFERDVTGGTWTNTSLPVTTAFFSTQPARPDQVRLLPLPNGKVILTYANSSFLTYTPGAGQVLPAAKPVITSVRHLQNWTFELTGTGLAGLSAGVASGMGGQATTDYPVIQRYNTGRAVSNPMPASYSYLGTRQRHPVSSKGDQSIKVEFELPLHGGQDIWNGVDTLRLVVNGVASDPYTFSGAHYVNFNFPDFTANWVGTYVQPWNTLQDGVQWVNPGGIVFLMGPRTGSLSNYRISKSLRLTAIDGPVRLAQ